jgi:hypothetical protein
MWREFFDQSATCSRTCATEKGDWVGGFEAMTAAMP